MVIRTKLLCEPLSASLAGPLSSPLTTGALELSKVSRKTSDKASDDKATSALANQLNPFAFSKEELCSK